VGFWFCFSNVVLFFIAIFPLAIINCPTRAHTQQKLNKKQKTQKTQKHKKN